MKAISINDIARQKKKISPVIYKELIVVGSLRSVDETGKKAKEKNLKKCELCDALTKTRFCKPCSDEHRSEMQRKLQRKI